MVNELNLTMLKEKRYVLPCRCGQKLAVIYDNGDVFPCELLEAKIGNLRDCNYDLQALLASPKAKKDRQIHHQNQMLLFLGMRALQQYHLLQQIPDQHDRTGAGLYVAGSQELMF